MPLVAYQFESLFLDHVLEVNIDFDALQLIVGLSFTLEFACFFHLEPPSVAVQLDLVDLISGRDLTLVTSILSPVGSLDHRGTVVAEASRLDLGHDSVLLFQAFLPLSSRAVSRQPLFFELVEDSLWSHAVDLSFFLGVLEFSLLPDALLVLLGKGLAGHTVVLRRASRAITIISLRGELLSWHEVLG